MKTKLKIYHFEVGTENPAFKDLSEDDLKKIFEEMVQDHAKRNFPEVMAVAFYGINSAEDPGPFQEFDKFKFSAVVVLIGDDIPIEPGTDITEASEIIKQFSLRLIDIETPEETILTITKTIKIPNHHLN